MELALIPTTPVVGGDGSTVVVLFAIHGIQVVVSTIIIEVNKIATKILEML